MKEHLLTAIEAAISAGKEIMKVYFDEDFQVETKSDNSPLTIADKRANTIINDILTPIGIPIISEENLESSYDVRRNWGKCWIVDPLDGTKEFIKRNGEFTVNIALVREGKPEIGVIYAPALKLLYFSDGTVPKAFKAEVKDEGVAIGEILAGAKAIFPQPTDSKIIVVGSRSHLDSEILEFIEGLKNDAKEVEVISRGSSLKFCMIAEGSAHIYPRFGPTMEWDTAAGQAICEAVGLSCRVLESGEKITYNRENLKNSSFIVSYAG